MYVVILRPEDIEPHPCPDFAGRRFRSLPGDALIQAMLGVDEEAARWLAQITVRMPPGEGLSWLNDVAIALARDYPLHPVMVAATINANHGLIWKRKVSP